MRLFLAVPLPPPAEGAVRAALSQLRATGWPVRWVRDEGLHITLKFYGDVPESRLDVIEEVLRNAVQGTRRVDLALGDAGAFPTIRRARILRLDVVAEPKLELLQDRIERASQEIGYSPEGRPFFPHVTLGRVREGERLPREAGEILERLETRCGFGCDRLVLYESRQGPQGPEYHERSVQRLGGEAG